MKSRSLPGGPWEKLFPRALALIDEISRYGGIKDPFWTLGGGTVLMFRYHHRMSKDIDIFVPDPQYLGFVTPRLSDTAADLTQDCAEQPGSFSSCSSKKVKSTSWLHRTCWLMLGKPGTSAATP